MEYTLVRSKRKTLALQVTGEATLLVRAPLRASKAAIERFVQSHRQWALAQIEKQRQYRIAFPEPDERELAALRTLASAHIPPRVAHYARMMGVNPVAVKITSARTRFGSCSGKNSLCFSCRLMRYPSEAVDYVVVHELAHIIHKNHGDEFYALIASILPDYKARKALLRQIPHA